MGGGGKGNGNSQKSLQDRAGRWYKKAVPGLSGLVRGKAEKRLAELERDDAGPPAKGDSPPQQPGQSILLDLQNKTVGVNDTQTFYDKMAGLFPSSQNKAKDGVLTISSWESASWAPNRVFSGYRTGHGCCLGDPKGILLQPGGTPPRGRYILLFAKTENGGVKGADPWGAATVSVDGSQAVPLLYMASQKIAVIDLGRMWRIKKIAILVRGEGHPGLAGIEIHESTPARSRRGPVSSRRRLAAAPLPSAAAMRSPPPPLGGRWATLVCTMDQVQQRWRKAIVEEMSPSTRKAKPWRVAQAAAVEKEPPMPETFDPYHKWLGIPPAEQPPNHYRLLAIPLFESDPDVIANAADQRMGHVRSFQIGVHTELSQRLLNAIAAARVCLLDARKKAVYDAALRCKAPPEEVPKAATSAATPVRSGPTLDLELFDLPAAPYHPRSFRRRAVSWRAWAVNGALVLVMAGIAAFVVTRNGNERRRRRRRATRLPPTRRREPTMPAARPRAGAVKPRKPGSNREEAEREHDGAAADAKEPSPEAEPNAQARGDARRGNSGNGGETAEAGPCRREDVKRVSRGCPGQPQGFRAGRGGRPSRSGQEACDDGPCRGEKSERRRLGR